MKNTATQEQLINRLVEVFGTPAMLEEYNNGNDRGTMREGICGWSGVMAPLNRIAYIEDFGASRLEEAEGAARHILKNNELRYSLSNYFKHQALATQIGNHAPKAGDFVWAVCSGLKCDDGRGIYGEIETAATYKDIKMHRQLCAVDRVFIVSADEFNENGLADKLVHDIIAAGEKFPGGSRNDDPELHDVLNEYRYWFTVAAAVVCPELGRWFLIDSEGYDYPRYCLMPENWREMFADAVQEAINDKAARDAEEARKEEEEKNARRAAYLERCAKWEPLMIDIRPLEEAATKAEYKTTEYKTAQRKLNDARRGNIAAMIRAAFPGLKFSIRKNNGWGADYELTYTDGPTIKEFCAAVDVDLFCAASDEFDGMTDCTYTAHREFTDFADKYMCMDYGGEIKVDREQSDENRAQMLQQYSDTLPELPNDLKDWKSEHEYTWKEAQKLAAAWGCDADELWKVFDGSICCSSAILRGFNIINFYTATDTTPTDPKPRKRTTSDTDSDEAPAEGLELVEIADGLAVVGDSRATYTNRKAIKAHGAKWNKAAQQWQATTPEACAALRGWFSMNDTTETPTEAEPLPEPPAAVVIDETPASQKAEDKPASQKAAPAEGQPDADELFILAAFYMPEGVTADELRTIAHGAILNPSDTAAEQLKAEAVRTAAAMMHRAEEIRTGCNSMREQNNNPDFNAVDVNSDDYLNAWDECNTQIETFEDYADDIENIAYCIAIAAGLSIEEADGLAATYKPEQDDPAQLAIAFNNPAPVATVTDAEVLATAARIRANYEALKAEAAAATPSDEKTDEQPAPPAVKKAPRSQKLQAVKERRPRVKHSALCRSMLRNMGSYERGKIVGHGVNLASPSLTVSPKNGKQSTARILKDAQKEGRAQVLVAIEKYDYGWGNRTGCRVALAWLTEDDKWATDTTKGRFDEMRRNENTKLYLCSSEPVECADKRRDGYDPFERENFKLHEWARHSCDKSGYKLTDIEAKKREAHRYFERIRREQAEAAFNTDDRDQAIKNAQQSLTETRMKIAEYIIDNNFVPSVDFWRIDWAVRDIERSQTAEELKKAVDEFTEELNKIHGKLTPKAA